MGEVTCPSRILVVDDHALLRKGMIYVLSYQADIEVVGEGENGLDALKLCQKMYPDLVLMDVSMPKMDGIEATRSMKESCPKTAVLMVTAHANEELMLKAIRAGAAGYVLKGDDPLRLVSAVREALGGESPMGQKLSVRLLRRLAAEESSPDGQPQSEAKREPQKPSPAVLLSPWELEVLRRVVAGKTNRFIAQELHLSLSTVKRHLERVVSKLGVSDRTQAAVRAIELGLLPK